MVQPVDPATQTQPVTLTFSSVTTPGVTSAVSSGTGPIAPSGFQAGNPARFYDVSTTAGYTPPITICFDTTGVSFPGGLPRLFHSENGSWVDVTTSFNAPQLCGRVNSLSPFAAFVRKRAPVVIRCVVPRVRGKTLAQARSLLKKANCTLGKVRRARSRKVRKGRIISQRPSPGTKLRRGSRVDVVVARGR